MKEFKESLPPQPNQRVLLFGREYIAADLPSLCDHLFAMLQYV